MILQFVQVRCIAFLKLAIGKAMLSGALVSSLNEVCYNIDAQHVRSEFRRWQCRGAIAASKIQNFQTFCDSKSLDERLPLSRMLSAMRVKSPFSQSALFGFMGAFIRRLA